MYISKTELADVLILTSLFSFQGSLLYKLPWKEDN